MKWGDISLLSDSVDLDVYHTAEATLPFNTYKNYKQLFPSMN